MSVRSLFLLIGLLVGSALAGRAADRAVERTFSVTPGCRVVLDTYRGSVIIEESDVPEVRVMLQLQVGEVREEDAERAFAALQYEATETGNTVTLRTRNPRDTGVRFVWNERPELDLAWRVTVPRSCDVDVRTHTGSITVGSLTGQIAARTERGTIFLKRINGSVDVSVTEGDVLLSRCTRSARVRVLRGTIRAGTIGGAADLKNTTGDIEVLAARAGITASAEAGDLEVGFPRDFSGDAHLTTSGGNIRVSIDPSASCTVDASSVWGRVENTLPLTVETSRRNKLVGQLGHGGPALTLHANGGHVKIAPGETYFE